MRERTKERRVNLKKATTVAVVANSLQIVLVLWIAAWLLLSPGAAGGRRWPRVLAGSAALVVAFGAAGDIRDAFSMRRMLEELDDMDAAMRDLNALNTTLRAQRHDFLNHVQVVRTLIELQDYQEAGRYIDGFCGEIEAVSQAMKTAIPAVNAVLHAKTGALEKERIKTVLSIRGSWQGLPMPDWEMCKVLSNLIDNARDAVKHTRSPQIAISLWEDDGAFRFEISNNGPPIAAKNLGRIFEPGVSTKGSGRGMGLYIVRQTLRDNGGDISVRSASDGTAFTGYVPRPKEVQT